MTPEELARMIRDLMAPDARAANASIVVIAIGNEIGSDGTCVFSLQRYVTEGVAVALPNVLRFLSERLAERTGGGASESPPPRKGLPS